MDECCYEVLGSCLQLEELYVYPHSPHPKGKSCYDYTLAKLKRYKLEMGDHGYGNEFWNEGTQSLCLGKLNVSILGEIIKDLAQRATSVKFYKLQGGCKTFIPNIVQAVGGMNELTKLHLQCCSEIDCIIDETTLCNDVVVPKLDELKLTDMANLKQLCRGPSPLSLFQKLESLSISNCPQLLHIFLVSVARTLLSLKKLEIKECSELKNVLEGEEEQALHDQIETPIELPHLEHLNLKNLPNLVRICSKRYHLRCPSLKEVVCWDCPNMELQEFKGLHLRNEEYKPLAVIEEIYLHNCTVECNFFCQTGIEEHIPTFQYLESLTLKRCARLKFVFSAHICQSLLMLWKVTISDCEELEAIFLGNEENEKNVFITEACLPKLRILEIESCNKLKFVLSFMIKVATSMLPQLSTLTILNSSQLEEIFRCSNIEDHDIDNEMEIMFPNLKQVTLVKLPRLVNVRQRFKLQRGEFCNVYIRECPKFMPITSATIRWTIEGLERQYVLKWSQLNNNEALNLSLPVLIVGELDIQSPKVDDEVEVRGDDDQEETKDSEMLRSEQRMLEGFVPTQVLSFQYLHSLKMVRCKKLKFLFSIRTIVHNSLSNLSFLTLCDSDELEEIIQDNEEYQVMSNDRVHFPELRWLEVKRCDKLIRLFPISMSTSFPQLYTLCINGADQLEVIFGDSSEDAANYSGKIVLSSLIRMELENLPNFINVYQGMQNLQQLGTISTREGELCEVKVHECPKFMPITSATIWWTEERLDGIYELKRSQLNNNEALNLLLPILNVGQPDIQSPRVHHEFQVMGDDYEEDDDQKETDDSKMLRSEEQMPGGLVPTQVLIFQYIHSLKMTRCKKLKFLFSVSTIVHNSLPKLSSLSLSDCEELEVIFGHSSEDEANYSENIMLSSLKKIELKNLPSFISVCQGMQIQVQLSNICIDNCPKFLDSSLELALQQLGTILVSTENSKFQPIADVRRQLPVDEEKGMILTSSVKSLRLIASGSLVCVWEGPTFISFQNLSSLEVKGCKKLKCIFSNTVIRSLPCLRYLNMSDCEELEEIMSSEPHFPNASSSSVCCFPQLQQLWVSKCRKLKWLFPSLPSTQHLPLLGCLDITQCSELEGVFSREVEIQEEWFYDSPLPELFKLVVEGCPMFSETTLAALRTSIRSRRRR
ncbi:uncharacterized protein LOC129317714 isoform X2 [Prosopis cineraria]|uniref:uncharacterized protein LOC129317714 isoform X2 n=1 Tax=Prosopis cineraria TaxID=364024 RepID=UPI00240F73E9|nr:uncharacterized protein LOC129317714 isoform X2 [Prosopis cineraria]